MAKEKKYEEDYEEQEELVSVGKLLRDQRESEGIHVESAAQELYIDKVHLHAIENDDFRQMKGVVFIRGYVRNYARYLNLDVVQIMAMLEPHIERFQQLQEQNQTSSKTSRSNKKLLSEIDYTKANFSLKSRKTTSMWQSTLIILVLAVVVSFVVFRYLSTTMSVQQRQIDIQIEAEEKPVDQGTAKAKENPVPVVVEEHSIVETSPIVIDETEDNAKESPPIAEHVYSVDETADSVDENFLISEQVQATNLEIQSPPPLGTKNIRFHLQNEVWLEIFDGDNKQVVSRLFAKDEDIRLQVKTPISIVIGDVNNTDLLVDDELYNLEQHSRGNVARFTLP